MSEISPLSSYESHVATHKERISVYIGDGMTAEDRESATILGGDFADSERPMAKTAVLIPVAAHQDADYIVPTLGEYAKQKTDDPFTVFLYLNAPLDTAEHSRVTAAQAKVFQARKLFPQLDVRASTTFYSEATIGKIRRDLWNAALLLAYHEHGFSTDVIGINNDIDSHRISPHYVARVQQYYERRAKNRQFLAASVANTAQNPIATRVSHAVIPTHPNTGKVTSWVDNTYFQAPGHASYEAGLVIPFSHYANMLGFDEDSKTHETKSFNNGRTRPFLSGAQLYTSPRRYIERLHEHDTSEIWTHETFGADDTCREALRPDITAERAEEVIFERLRDDIMHFWLPGTMRPIYRKIDMAELYGKPIDLAETIAAATSKVEKQLAKAERLLRVVADSALLADILHDSFDAETYATTQVHSIYNLHKAFSRGSDAFTLQLQE